MYIPSIAELQLFNEKCFPWGGKVTLGFCLFVFKSQVLEIPNILASCPATKCIQVCSSIVQMHLWSGFQASWVSHKVQLPDLCYIPLSLVEEASKEEFLCSERKWEHNVPELLLLKQHPAAHEKVFLLPAPLLKTGLFLHSRKNVSDSL